MRYFDFYQPTYRILNLLGEGGFGKVYKAVLSDRREVAMKFMTDFSEKSREDFRNEIY